VVLSLIGWTWLARQLRGKVLSLREEEFVLATQLTGGSDARVHLPHLLPEVSGHIIVVSTLAVPGMILAETALTFLGIGIRPRWSVGARCCRKRKTSRPWRISVAADASRVHRRRRAGLQFPWRRPAATRPTRTRPSCDGSAPHRNSPTYFDTLRGGRFRAVDASPSQLRPGETLVGGSAAAASIRLGLRAEVRQDRYRVIAV